MRTALLLMLATLPALSADKWVTLPGKDDKAKHIVFVSGDEEYRSEEVLPQLAHSECPSRLQMHCAFRSGGRRHD